MKKVNFAVDLGTTNIEVALVGSDDQHIISNKTIKNRQSLYGSDVINRIAAVVRDERHLEEMREFVLSDLGNTFKTMLDEGGYKFQNVGKICICGNTTMISILLEYDISTLGHHPFKTVLTDSVVLPAGKLFGDLFSEDVNVFLSGCASAFIGGDILSGLYYLYHVDDSKFNNDNISLFIDMGTNGEIVLNKKGVLYGTSTACGPAFEGCTRKQHVYGYSTIDAISLGINSKVIKRSGLLAEEYSEKGINISGVHLDMNIIEQISMAKAGIYTGICSLVSYAGLELTDVDRVYISGGFGFNLNIRSAVNIGLLPECFADKIQISGNTSLKGAIMLLDDKLNVPNAIDLYNIDVLQLANDKSFAEELINNMSFVRK